MSHCFGAGETAGDELLLGVGSRPSGMAEAYTAVVTGALAPFWNPAGLARLQYQDISLTHLMWMQNISLDTVAYAVNIGKKSGLSLFVSRLGIPDITVTNETLPSPDNPLSGQYSPANQTVSVGSIMGGIGFGWGLLPMLNVGANVKCIQENLLDDSATGFAGDLGAQVRLSDTDIAGLVVQNMSTGLDGFAFPLMARAGIAKRMSYTDIEELLALAPENKTAAKDILASLDLTDLVNSQDYGFHLGLEWAPKMGSTILALRGGIAKSTSSYLLLSCGVGLALEIGSSAYALDYAFVPMDQLGDAQRISLGASF